MRFYILIFSLFFIHVSFSQDKCKYANRKINKIEQKILIGDNDRVFQELIKIESLCGDPIFLHTLADMYFSIKELDRALNYYVDCYNVSGLKCFNSMSLKNFLNSAYNRGLYSVFNMVVTDSMFHIKIPIDEKMNNLIEKNNFALRHKKDAIIFNPILLDINSDSDEYFPSMPINSDIIIFTYRDKNSEFKDENFFISKKYNEKWTDPVKLGDNINSEYREGSLSVSLHGKDLYFTSCHRPDSYGGCDIYYATLINDTLWSDSYNIGSVINSEYWDSQPCISSDGNLLFFVSNRYGGYGGADIWVTRRIQGGWSSPVNLGSHINTSGDEATPFLHYDNQSFYFSSQGHNGFGGYDLYMSSIDSLGKMSNPVNLGYPINTHHNESGLIVSKDGLTAYYNSDSRNNLDIYQFDLPNLFMSNPVSLIQGFIIDSISRKGISADVTINELHHFKKYDLLSDFDGFFSCPVPTQSDFSITVSCEGYDFFSSNYQFDNDAYVKNINIVLNRLSVGNKIKLDNIYYDFDDFSLKQESLIELKKFATYLKKNSMLKIEIGGHTDNIGSEIYNNQLSQKRAQAVYQVLVTFGVSKKQMNYRGYGYTIPIINTDSDFARLKNRRTEVKIIGFYE